MIIHRCEQYTPEWWQVRRGVPSASQFGRIMTPVKCQLAAAHADYVCELVGDLGRLDYPGERAASPEMRNGTLCEPEARRFYEMERDEVEEVGFCLDDVRRFGCSPDGLVGEDGGLELKCPSPKVHVSYLLDGEVPGEYLCQVHGSLIVTGRRWWDFLSYCPGFKPLLVRVEPNDFTDKLRAVLGQFWPKFEAAKAAVIGDVRRAAA